MVAAASLELLVELADTKGAAGDRARVAKGQLPLRYAEPWAQPFFAYALPALRPGARILDVGSGRRPTFPRAVLPPKSYYVGLDVDEAELRAAPPRAYDEVVVANVSDATDAIPKQFDLIVSWQVFEHVHSLADTITNLYRALCPDGRLVFMVSGRYALFAVLGRFVSHGVRVGAMAKLLGADPAAKFPTHYDRCYAGALEDLLSSFSYVEILPRYKGASYLRFCRPAEVAYLRYENWLVRSAKRDLATHYVVLAVR